MNLLKISRFPDFIQFFPDFSQRFPDFSLTKFFKVRKCERCGSLNPRLHLCILLATSTQIVEILSSNDFSYFVDLDTSATYSNERLEPVNSLIQEDNFSLYNSGIFEETVTAKRRQHPVQICLLYTSPSPRDKRQSRMPSSA